MNTTQYRNFVMVAECRNITKAAKELLIAQPALTSQIKRMEEEVGSQLFIRYPRSVALTEAGEILYKAAKNILQLEENAYIGIDNLSRGSGMLRMGISLFLPDPRFQQIMKRYYIKYPNVLVSLYEESSTDILSKLENGVIEVAIITYSKEIPPCFKAIPIADPEQLYACRIPGSTYLRDKNMGETIELSALEGIPISTSRGLIRYIEDCFQKKGIEMHTKAVSNSRHGTLELAIQGNMVALLAMPENIEECIPHMIYNPISIEDMTVQKYLVIYQGRLLSLAARKFIDVVAPDLLN